jgi:hypothetical protein
MVETGQQDLQPLLEQSRQCVRDAHQYEQWALSTLALDRNLRERARVLVVESRALLQQVTADLKLPPRPGG